MPSPDREFVEIKTDLLTDDGEVRDGETEEQLAELAASIRRDGLLQPIVIAGTARLDVVDGRRRLRAARRAGLETVPCIRFRELPRAEQERIALELNVRRLKASAADKQRLVELLRPQAEAAAKASHKAGSRRGGKGGKKASPTLPSVPTGKVTKRIASQVGESAETVRKRLAVVKAADEHPVAFGDIAGALRRGEMAPDAAYKELRRREKELADADRACAAAHALRSDPAPEAADEASSISEDDGTTGPAAAPAEAGGGPGAVASTPAVARQLARLAEDVEDLAEDIFEFVRSVTDPPLTVAELRRLREPLAGVVGELDALIANHRDLPPEDRDG